MTAKDDTQDPIPPDRRADPPRPGRVVVPGLQVTTETHGFPAPVLKADTETLGFPGPGPAPQSKSSPPPKPSSKTIRGVAPPSEPPPPSAEGREPPRPAAGAKPGEAEPEAPAKKFDPDHFGVTTMPHELRLELYDLELPRIPEDELYGVGPKEKTGVEPYEPRPSGSEAPPPNAEPLKSEPPPDNVREIRSGVRSQPLLEPGAKRVTVAPRPLVAPHPTPVSQPSVQVAPEVAADSPAVTTAADAPTALPIPVLSDEKDPELIREQQRQPTVEKPRAELERPDQDKVITVRTEPVERVKQVAKVEPRETVENVQPPDGSRILKALGVVVALASAFFLGWLLLRPTAPQIDGASTEPVAPTTPKATVTFPRVERVRSAEGTATPSPPASPSGETTATSPTTESRHAGATSARKVRVAKIREQSAAPSAVMDIAPPPGSHDAASAEREETSPEPAKSAAAAPPPSEPSATSAAPGFRRPQRPLRIEPQ